MKDLQKGGKNLMKFVKEETMKKGPGYYAAQIVSLRRVEWDEREQFEADMGVKEREKRVGELPVESRECCMLGSTRAVGKGGP